MSAYHTDTIAAIATPAGRGGIGVIRISGPEASAIAQSLCGRLPRPRYAHFCQLKHRNKVIDEGLALFFPGPNSFTGEDVLELQGHGGPVVMDMLLSAVLNLGARAARPGEFSERAFLNDKLDLAQAEAIADLIDASSTRAAHNALQSLQGEFSRLINALSTGIVSLRVYVEAAIDFPEEEIDFLADGHISQQLSILSQQCADILSSARQGAVIREGLTVVIAGRPNAGKSSLLNALAQRESAIVTDIAGTTRDTLKEYIQIDGLPLQLIDTAGLRASDDKVEQIGIERAWSAIATADLLLWVTDSSDADGDKLSDELRAQLPPQAPVCKILNKIDLSGLPEGWQHSKQATHSALALSAATGAGIAELRSYLKQSAGLDDGSAGGHFTARRRHLKALEGTLELIQAGEQQLQRHGAGELLAEDLRQAHEKLGEITGAFTSDELLGEIFSSFCIGK